MAASLIFVFPSVATNVKHFCFSFASDEESWYVFSGKYPNMLSSEGHSSMDLGTSCKLSDPQFSFFFFFNKFILFIYFWLHWVFVAVHGLSLVAASGGYSSLQCAGFSLWWLLLLQSTGSRHTGFSSCGMWAQ